MQLRHLPSIHLEAIARILDDSALPLVMGNIVKDPNDENCAELRFDSSDIDAIRNHATLVRRSPLLILIDEWSTMGRDRPKLKHLLSLLIKCQFFRAADYIANILGTPLPPRPATGPAAAVDISLSDDPVPLVNGLSHPVSSTNSVNRNRPDNKPSINAPNLDLLNQVPPNTQSVNPSLPMIPHQGTNATRSNNQSQSSPHLIDFNSSASRRSPAPQPSPSAASTDLIPAISALHVTPQIPVTVQSEQSAPVSMLPAFSGLMEAESNNQLNEAPAVLPIMDLGSNASGPAFSRIFAESSIQKSSTQSTMQSSSVSDSEEDTDDS